MSSWCSYRCWFYTLTATGVLALASFSLFSLLLWWWATAETLLFGE